MEKDKVKAREPETIKRMNGSHKLDLRDEQKETVRVLNELENRGSYSTVVNMPTGAGKTRTMTEYLLKNGVNVNKKVLWLANRETLLEQACKAFKECAYEKLLPDRKEFKCQLVSCGQDRLVDIVEDTDVLFVTTQSVSGSKKGIPNYWHLASWLGYSEKDGKIIKNKKNTELFIVLDEAHHIGGEVLDKFFEYLFGVNSSVVHIENYEEIKDSRSALKKTGQLNIFDWGIEKYYFIGLTATAFREDNLEVGFFKWFKDGYDFEINEVTHSDVPLGHYGFEVKKGRRYGISGEKLNQIAPTSYEQLFSEGVLIKPEIHTISDFEGMDRKNEECKSKLLLDIEERFLKTNQFKKTLIFAEDTEQADKLYERAKETALICTTRNKTGNVETSKVLELFEKSEKNTLIVVDIVSEGYDLPELDAIVLIAPIKSRIRLRQRIGRALRNAENKEKAHVFLYKFDGDYLDPASFKEPIRYKDYYVSAYEVERYKNILVILDQFTDDELLDYIGNFMFKIEESSKIKGHLDKDISLDEIRIYLDEDLKNGFQQLYQRLRCDVLLTEEKIVGYEDYVKFWEQKCNRLEKELLEDIKKVCFFLCNVKKGIFHVSNDNIKLFIEYVLSNDGSMPDYEDKYAIVIQEVQNILESKEQSLLIQEVQSLLEDEEQSILGNKEIDLTERWNKIVVMVKEGLSERDVSVEEGSDAVIEEVVKKHLAFKRKGIDSIKKEVERRAVGNEQQEIEKVIEVLIETEKKRKHTKTERARKRKNSTEILKYKDADGDEVIEAKLKDIRSLISLGVLPAPERINTRCTCKNCNRERPIVYMTFAQERIMCERCAGKKETRQPYKLVSKYYYSGQVLAQSIITNKHHLVVTKEDLEEFQNSIIHFLKAYNITKSIDEIEQLACEFICRIGMKGTDDFLSICCSNLKENNKVPRLLMYFLYEEVYDQLWSAVNFIKDGMEHNRCQNKDALEKTCRDTLMKYGLDENAFAICNLTPVADVIIDYLPYKKVIQYYQGIKPELLCRMQNMLLAQVMDGESGVNQLISAFGGSGADLLNRVNIPDNITVEVYNEIGKLHTAFYKTLADDTEYEKLIGLIKEFIECVLTAKTDYSFPFLVDLEPEKAERLREDIKEKYKKTNLELGEDARKKSLERAEGMSKEILGGKRLLFLYRQYFSDDSDLEQLIKRENILFGMHQKLLLMYKQYQCEVKKDISEDYVKAFILFISLTFTDRYLFNNCLIEKFISFCVNYEDWLEFGRERCRNLQIRCGDALTIVDEPQYNNEKTVMYMDIPYAETDSATYFSKFFKVSDFISALNRFQGKYIVSSRYNICAGRALQNDYYESLKIEDGEEILYEYNKTGVIDKCENIADFYRAFFPSIHKMPSGYGHISSENSKAKYVIMPFTDVQMLIANEEGARKLVRNNTALAFEDVERMFIRTIFTNIPVEVMITNIEFKRDKELKLMKAYELEKDSVWAIPSFELTGIGNSPYHAVPVYIVLKYERFLTLQDYAMHYEEYRAREEAAKQEEVRNTAAAFNKFVKEKYR